MWPVDVQTLPKHKIMPHVVIERNDYGTLSPRKLLVRNNYTKYTLRNLSPRPPNRVVARPKANCYYKHEEMDKETYMRKLDLVATAAGNDSAGSLLETKLTRSPLRSQICREGFAKNYLVKNMTEVDFSSVIGQLLTNRANSLLPFDANSIDGDAYTLTGLNKHERFCNESYLPDSEKMQALRARALTTYPVTYQSSKRGKLPSTRVYCFNRKQKIEHKRTLATGLNKRSRILKKMCKPLRICVERIKVNVNQRVLVHRNEQKKQLKVKPKSDIEHTNTKREVQSPMIGKEIVLDGNIVIDLCSDDENDDIVILPKCSSKSSLTNGATTVNDTRVTENQFIYNDSSKRAKTNSIYQNNNNKHDNRQRTITNFFVADHVPRVIRQQVNNVECKVKIRDIAKSFTRAPNGQTYVANTQVRVGNNGDNIQGKKSTTNNSFFENDPRDERMNNGFKVFQTARMAIEKDNNAKTEMTPPVNRKGNKFGGGITTKLNHQMPSTARKSTRPDSSTTQTKKVQHRTMESILRTKNVGSGDGAILNRRSVSEKEFATIPTVVQFKCHICGSNGFFAHKYFEKNITQHIVNYHGGYTGIVVIKHTSAKTGSILIEAKANVANEN